MFFLRTIDFCLTSRQDLFGRAQKTLSFSLTYFRHENIVFITFFYAQNGLRDSGVKSLGNFEIAVEDVSVKKRLGRRKSDVWVCFSRKRPVFVTWANKTFLVEHKKFNHSLSHVLLMEKSCSSLFWWRKWYSRFLSEKTWKFWDRCRRRLSQETAQKNEKRYLRIFFSRTIDFRCMSQQDLFRRAQKTPSSTHTFSRHKK